MRDNDIVFFNIHRRYLNHVPSYGGFLGIYILAAFVNENGWRGQAFSGALAESREIIDEMCEAGKVRMIGLYCDYANVTETCRVSCHIKETYGIPVLVGGPQATSLKEEFFRESRCDAVVCYEGELTVLALMDFFLDGTGALADIAGIACLRGDKLARTAARMPIENLDALPFVDEECYLLPERRWRGLSLMTGRGCPFHCAFCHEGHLSRRVRFRSVENVLAEIDIFLASLPSEEVPYILFTDDAFTLDERRVQAICAGLRERRKERPFHWFCEGHVHTLKKHPAMIEAMVEAGLLRIQLGIESGVQRVLDAYRKNTTPEEIKEVVAACRDAGIQQIYGNIILGSAFFSEETYVEDLAFGKELIELGQGTLELGVVSYWPLPETSMTKAPEQYGLRIVDYDFHTSLDDFPQTETADFDRWQIFGKMRHMEREFARRREEMLLARRVPLERMTSWYSLLHAAKAYGLWWQSLQKLPHVYAYGDMIASGEAMPGEEARDLGEKAHPMRVLSLNQYLEVAEAGGGNIAGVELDAAALEVLVLATGRKNCRWMYEELKGRGVFTSYGEMREVLQRLEADFLLVYSREIFLEDEG